MSVVLSSFLQKSVHETCNLDPNEHYTTLLKQEKWPMHKRHAKISD